jgi:hypothetical protein
MLTRTSRRILTISAFATILLWIYPPVARLERIVDTPSYVMPLPSDHLERRSEHHWVWQLRPEDDIWWGVLLARIFAVWTAAGLACAFWKNPAQRFPNPSTSRHGHQAKR